MALGRPVHAPEAADGTTRSSVALNVAPGSAVHGGLAQMFTPPPPPPPPDFRHPPIAGSLHFSSTALDSPALLNARTAPQTPLESRQDACQWTPARQVGRAHVFQQSQTKSLAIPLCILFNPRRAGERCNVDSQVDQVVCDSRTAGSTARYMVARSPLLGAGTVPHPVLPALPAISTERHPLPLQVRHAPSPVERNGLRPIPAARR